MIKLIAKLGAGATLVALSACTSQAIRHDQTATSMPLPAQMTPAPIAADKIPASTQTKGNKTLRLVRMMDGGACKNDQEGVKGVFLLYADPDDIERIKTQQGTQVFAGFETTIETFSSKALQQAVNRTRFTLDPFALGVTDAQTKVTRQLLQAFAQALTQPIEQFEQQSGLTINVTPFLDSLIFYTEGCDATHFHQEGEQEAP